MTFKDFYDAFIKVYGLDGFLSYQRSSGKNLYYKKVLIIIMRDKFRMSFPQIAKHFKNDHTTILHHYVTSTGLEGSVEDAWKLYRSK